MMERHVNIPELLAPAGSREAFEAAIAAGADAVYLSGTRFGARAYAANFEDMALRTAIQDAHSRGIRVYVTVNTLVSDEELKTVGEYLIFLYTIGVDAILVQDHGVLSLARYLVPALPLHASTQMTIHSVEGVRYAAEHGISRVVLARELPIDEVREINSVAKGLNVGIELFAHGALCMGYSGQCLLSSVIGGRSGNRGRCAQPCRRKYMPVIGVIDRYGRVIQQKKAEDEEWHYLLSPKDLATYEHLSEMRDSAALKIEGRMKSPEYVAIVTSLYRKALDLLLAGRFTPDPEALLSAAFAFNRGFTQGHLFGAKGQEYVSEDRPDNQGIRFGTVLWYDRVHSEAVIGDLSSPLPERGDGIVFSKEGEEDVGCEIRSKVRVDGGRIRVKISHTVKNGMEASINKRGSVEQAASTIISSYPRGGGRKIPIALSVSMDAEHLKIDGRLTGPRGDLITVTARSVSPMVEAKTRPLTVEVITDLLTRTGETWFEAVIEEMQYPGTLFLPIQEITGLRREILSDAATALIRSCEPEPEEAAAAEERLRVYLKRDHDPAERRSDLPSVAVYADSIEQVKGAIAGGCDRIYYEPTYAVATCGRRARYTWDEWQQNVLADLAEVYTLSHGKNILCFWKFPEITRRQFLDHALPLLKDAASIGIAGVMVGGVGVAEAVRQHVPEMAIAGSSALNITNHAALEEIGATFASSALSKEISRAELQGISIRKSGMIEFFVQGSVPAMITNHCLAYGRHPCPSGEGRRLVAIMDQTGRSFPVRVDGECRTIIGNAVETCLIDHLPEILDSGVVILGIELRGRTEEYASIVCRAYRSALSGGDIDALKDEIRSVSWGGITTGPFLSGGVR